MAKKKKNGISGHASKGGKARREALSPEMRSEIARRAVEARWEREGKLKEVPHAICGSADRPLVIAGIEIPCYVLSDERRVLIQRSMIGALDMAQGTAGRGDGDRLGRFLATKALNPFVESKLRDVITEPIRFRVDSGSVAYGYEATVLADICDVVLEARKEGKLHYQQEHIAERCEMLIRSFAKVGITALVDEATGYQYIRQRDALEQLLEEYLSEELRRWVKTFPPEYFKQLCRLRGVPYRPDMRLPQYFGHLTNDIVYKRLAPGVLDELQARNPSDNGRRQAKNHQWLSENRGHPALIDHLAAVSMLMKVADDWDSFKKLLDKGLPIYDGPSLFDSLDDESSDS